VNRKFRLTESQDFTRIKSTAQTLRQRFFILLFARNGLDISRVAVVASKRIGNAVERNRIRRRVRAGLQSIWEQVEPGWDMVFYTRRAILSAKFVDLENAIKHLLEKAGVL